MSLNRSKYHNQDPHLPLLLSEETHRVRETSAHLAQKRNRNQVDRVDQALPTFGPDNYPPSETCDCPQSLIENKNLSTDAHPHIISDATQTSNVRDTKQLETLAHSDRHPRVAAKKCRMELAMQTRQLKAIKKFKAHTGKNMECML
jgi:hypothetical protein